MQLEQLLHIIYADKFRSLTKAAEELFISQSAISQSISKLEIELGLPLFTRSRNGVIPTKEAAFFLNRADQIIKLMDEMNEQSKKINQLTRKLSIGTVAGLHLHFLTTALLTFQKKFPLLDIEYIEDSSLALRESILNSELDISLIVLYEKTIKPHNSLKIQPLMDIKFYVLVSKNSSLSNKPYAKYQDIAGEPLVMHNGEFMNWFLTDYMERNGKLHLLFKSNNTDTLREIIAKGTAITIETENELYSNPDIMSGQVVPIPLFDLGLPKSSLGLIYSTNKYDTHEKAEIIKSLATYITEWKYERIL